MVKTKIMPGEMFIVEYVNGGFSNRWGINNSQDYIELGVGRKAAAGFTDLLVEEIGKELKDARYHVVGGSPSIQYLDEVGFGDFEFANVPLKILKLLKQTEVYSSAGVLLGTIPANSEIGTRNANAGNSNKHLMIADCFRVSPTDSWNFLNQTSYSYGFVNIQKTFGLQRFDSTKNLLTTANGTVADVDWVLVSTVIDTVAPEVALRGDLSTVTKEELEMMVNDHFASKDLKDIAPMDPIQFFANQKNRNFVERELNKVDTVKAADFVAQALAF